ncbi:hypothetical protein AGMMS50289_04850 [Betaproteobacteria bacterium]|nr:hypothetical protein AGMMS50289_04850 [Betaproteobacteria bacterium]
MAAAGQTVNVGIAVTGEIYGNGDAPVTDSGNGSPDTTSANKLNGNTVNILSGGSVNGDIYGGYDGSGSFGAMNNTVNVNSGAGDITGVVVGGSAVEVSNNHVTFDAGYTGTVGNAIHGGKSYRGTFNNNTVTINDGTFNGAIYGAAANNAVPDNTFNNNTVTLNRGTFHHNVYAINGGTASSGANNKLIITGGAFDGSKSGNTTTIQGGANGASGEIIISGGAFNATNTYIVGGSSSNNNTVTISDEHGLSFNNLAYLSGGTNISTDNTLNLKTPLTVSGTFQNFQTLNFYLPTTLAAGNTLLTVTGSTSDITDSAIRVIGQSNLNLGDTVTLISKTSGTPAALTDDYTDATTGVIYGYDLSIDGSTTAIELFHNSINAPGNWSAPHADYTVDSSNGDVSLTVGGILSGVTTLNLKENGNTLIADIQILDARHDDLTVNLDGTQAWDGYTGVRFDTLELGGGHTFRITGSGAYTNFSTYDIYGQATYDGDLDATDGTLNFYLPSGIDNNDTLLTVTGNANINNSAVTLALDGSATNLTALTEGESIKLIESAGITGTVSNAGNKAKLTAGASFSANFTLSNDGSNLVAKRDVTYVPPVTPPPPPARTTPADLEWTGATNRNWNILTSENWTPESTFINGDTVTFTDTGFGQVNIVTLGVAPAATIFTNTQGHDYRVSGTLSGTGTLTKTGDGNLTLTGNNTYSGNTIINAGSLTLALSGALPNSNVSIASPATFNLYNRVGKNLTLANAARLNVYQGAAITGNLSAIGSQLNFYLPTIATNGYSLLNVGGTANITNSTVNVGILGSASPLTAGDTVTLINATSLTGNPANTIAHGTGMQGVSLLYDFDLTTNGKQLLATVAGGTPPIDPNPPVDPNPPTDPNPPVTPPTNPGINLNPQTKALAEGFLSGTAFLNQAQDFAAERGINSALQTVQSSDKHGFAAIGYSTLRHNTGSHIDVDGYTLLAGLAATTPTQTGNLTAAAFIEHGESNYDSYNSFSNAASVHGKGDTQYTGAGILARFAFDETQAAPLYLDASIRSGKVKTDFSGNLYDGFGRAAAYNAKSTYVSAHVGAGYVINLTEQSKLDVYGQYLWSHQNGDTVKLTTGETVKFKAVDSQRTRLGVKWHHALTTKTTAYVGAAWEHEYNAKANTSIYGYKLDTPKLKGDTGVLEAGLTLTPTAANQQGWSLDVGVQGYAGKREGVTGSVRARYRF